MKERRLQKLIELGREQQANPSSSATPTGAFIKREGTCGSSIPKHRPAPRRRKGTYAVVTIEDGTITDIAFHEIDRK